MTGPGRLRRSTTLAIRFITWLLVYLVLAGGIYPALYESQLPHDHLFVGGPPPANWENHPHANPLFVLFGAPAGSTAMAEVEPFVPIVADHPDVPARVVSVYPGVPGVVISILTVTMLATVLALVAPPPLISWLGFLRSRWPLVLTDGPATPPPRQA